MLREALKAYEYEVVGVPMKGALHLKSVCTALDDRTLLSDTRYFDAAGFSEYKLVEVPAEESPAANILRINGAIGLHAGFHQTSSLLRGRGYDVRTIDISEFLKAEAGLTCMSIIMRRMPEAIETQVKALRRPL